MKDTFGGKIMTKFFRLRAKTYSYLIDDGSEDKKAKGTKKCVTKRKPKFENYKNCLEATYLENKNIQEKVKLTQKALKNDKEFIRKSNSILKTQQRFKSK